ncbi:hypothetical protein [Catenovulum agarivorans]|uniref:hypothetical protein n=1 Tax=Catenovulum agarivorans TaxID=1172192 RepID=UPI0002EE25C4|nr:hypothetical protein [Catenovulum agarivorans]
MINSVNQNPFSAQSTLNSASNVQQSTSTSDSSTINSQQAQHLLNNILAASPTELFASVSSNKMNVSHALSLVD